MGSRYHQICLCQSPQEEGDLEFLQAPHRAGSCFRFFCKLCPFPTFVPRRHSRRTGGHKLRFFPGPQGSNCFGTGRGQFSIPLSFPPCPTLLLQLEGCRELARVSHSRRPLPKGAVPVSFPRILGMPLAIPPDGNCSPLNISSTRPNEFLTFLRLEKICLFIVPLPKIRGLFTVFLLVLFTAIFPVPTTL